MLINVMLTKKNTYGMMTDREMSALKNGCIGQVTGLVPAKKSYRLLTHRFVF